jgi:hypothetical protein
MFMSQEMRFFIFLMAAFVLLFIYCCRGKKQRPAMSLSLQAHTLHEVPSDDDIRDPDVLLIDQNIPPTQHGTTETNTNTKPVLSCPYQAKIVPGAQDRFDWQRNLVMYLTGRDLESEKQRLVKGEDMTVLDQRREQSHSIWLGLLASVHGCVVEDELRWLEVARTEMGKALGQVMMFKYHERPQEHGDAFPLPHDHPCRECIEDKPCENCDSHDNGSVDIIVINGEANNSPGPSVADTALTIHHLSNGQVPNDVAQCHTDSHDNEKLDIIVISGETNTSTGPSVTDTALTIHHLSNGQVSNDAAQCHTDKDPLPSNASIIAHNRVLRARPQIEKLLNGVDQFEELYPSHKAAKQHACYDSYLFQSRLDALRSWFNAATSLEKHEQMLMKWSGSADITQSLPLLFIERVLKESSVKKTFQNSVFRSVFRSLEKSKDVIMDYGDTFVEMNLPLFVEQMFRLCHFPAKLLQQSLEIRMQSTPWVSLASATRVMIDQLLDDLRSSLLIATDLKNRLRELVDAVSQWIDDLSDLQKYDTWKDFDQQMLKSLQCYIQLLDWQYKSQRQSQWLKDAAALEVEWEFLKTVGQEVDGGDQLITQEIL